MADINIENGIIGCILVEPESLYKVYNKLTPDMFTSDFCKRVYEKALSLYDKGIKFDETLLANEMATPEIKADAYLKQFMDIIYDTPSSVLINGYAEKLIASYKAKRLSLLIKEININPNNIEDTIGTLMKKLEEIETNERESSHTLAEIVKTNRGKYFNEQVGKGKVLKIGLDRLDECVSLVAGDVTVIGARPKVGKSALVTQLARNVARQGYRVGYFNLEMVEEQIYERLVASESEIDLKRIKKANNFLGDEESKFNKANDELARLNIDISTGSKTDMEIKAKCRHQNYDLIIIDYLQLIRSAKRCESRRVEVGEISKNIKALAMELKVPIVLLSQLSRNSEYKPNKEPTMADLRESGDIEQDASVIILMWNLSDVESPECKKYKGLKVDANRQGETMSEVLVFKGENMKFSESNETIDEVKQKLEEFKPLSYDDDSPFIN